MSEEEALKALSVISVAAALFITGYTFHPLRNANGSRPAFEFAIITLLLMVGWAMSTGYIAFIEEGRLPSSGMPLAIGVFGRLLPLLVSLASLRMTLRLNKRHMDYHHSEPHVVIPEGD